MFKKWFDKLNIYHKCSFLSAILLIVVSLCLIPLFFISLMEIPIGLALGLALGIIIYLIIGLLENRKKDTYRWAIVMVVMRLLLFAAVLVLIALSYYRWDFKIFNLFAYVGGYTLSTIIFIILYIKDKIKENK